MNKSIYERSNNSRQGRSNGICMGRITNVNIDTRLCRVKTFFGPSELLDLDLQNVQWVNVDGNSDGDESGSIPREGAIGLVFFIEGEPYIFGFIKPLNGTKGAVTGKEAVTRLVRGDKLISTKSGNHIVIRSNGSIEIVSKETLKTIYIPTDSRIIEVCRNFNFKTDGGYINWEAKGPAALGQELFTQEFRKDLARSFIVVEERGAVGASTIYRTSIGPGIPGVPGVPAAVYKFEVDVTGKASLAIGAGVPVMTADVGIDGSISVVSFSNIKVDSRLGTVDITADVGDITTYAKLGGVHVKSDAGDITAKTKAGNVEVQTTAGNVKVGATAGTIEMAGSLAKLKLSKGKVGMGGPAGELLAELEKLAQAVIDESTAAAVHVHPTAVGPSGPPTTAANFVAVTTAATAIKAIVTLLKGGI